MPTQQLLLLLRRQGHTSADTLSPSPPCIGIERTRQLAWAPLQHSGHRVSLSRARNGRCLGHEVEVEELDELELHLARSGAGFEEGRHGEQTIEGFERAGVEGVGDQGGDEGEQGGGLDGRAVDWFKEVEEKL